MFFGSIQFISLNPEFLSKTLREYLLQTPANTVQYKQDIEQNQWKKHLENNITDKFDSPECHARIK